MDIINKMTLILEVPEEWPEVIIVPFQRSLKSAVTRICAITCLDYNSGEFCHYGSPSLMAIS